MQKQNNVLQYTSNLKVKCKIVHREKENREVNPI